MNPLLSAKYCNPYAADTGPDIQQKSCLDQLTLSAQTGWDDQASIQYFVGLAQHAICGASGSPGDNPGWLAVGTY